MTKENKERTVEFQAGLLRLDELKKPVGPTMSVDSLRGEAEVGLGDTVEALENDDVIGMGRFLSSFQSLNVREFPNRIDYFGDDISEEEYRMIGDQNTEWCLRFLKGDSRAYEKITYLPLRIAEKMLANGGPIFLEVLMTLPTKSARVLSGHDGILSMKKLDQVDDEVLEALLGHSGKLLLDGLTSLTVRGARALAQTSNELSFNSLADISLEAARELVKFKWTLKLRGLKKLGVQLASILAEHGERLDLSGLTELTDAEARALTNHPAWILMGGMKKISNRALQTLAAAGCTVTFVGELDKKYQAMKAKEDAKKQR